MIDRSLTSNTLVVQLAEAQRLARAWARYTPDQRATLAEAKAATDRLVAGDLVRRGVLLTPEQIARRGNKRSARTVATINLAIKPKRRKRK